MKLGNHNFSKSGFLVNFDTLELKIKMSHCAGIIGHDKAILKWICFCFDSRAVGCSNVYLVKRDKIFCGLQRVASLIYPLFKKIRTVTIVNNIFDTFWEIPKWKQQQFLVSNSHMSDPRTLIFALKNNYMQWVIVMMFIVNSCRLIHAGKFRHWNDNAELILGLSCFLEAFQHDSISHLKTNPCCKKKSQFKNDILHHFWHFSIWQVWSTFQTVFQFILAIIFPSKVFHILAEILRILKW